MSVRVALQDGDRTGTTRRAYRAQRRPVKGFQCSGAQCTRTQRSGLRGTSMLAVARDRRAGILQSLYGSGIGRCRHQLIYQVQPLADLLVKPAIHDR